MYQDRRWKMRGLLCLILIFIFFMGLVDVGWAKYPEKRIRLIVPFAPGRGTDLPARIMAKYANPFLDNKIYVENIAGAAGALGFRAGAMAKPDGYTITMLATSISVSPHTGVKDYPLLSQFDPICVVAVDPATLVVKPDHRFKTVNDLVEYGKTHPDQVTMSTTGVGGINHLIIAAFGEATNCKFKAIPYDGSTPALVAAIGGHVDVGVSGTGGSLEYVRGGKLRPLVTLGAKRSKYLPEVKTAKELGIDVEMYMWRGAAVPKNTPKEIKSILEAAFRKAMESEESKKIMDNEGLEPIYMGPEEAQEWLKKIDGYHKMIADKTGLKVQ